MLGSRLSILPPTPNFDSLTRVEKGMIPPKISATLIVYTSPFGCESLALTCARAVGFGWVGSEIMVTIGST